MSAAAAQFSSRCSSDDVPGDGEHRPASGEGARPGTPGRRWLPVAGHLVEGPPGLRQLPAGQREPGDEPDPMSARSTRRRRPRVALAMLYWFCTLTTGTIFRAASIWARPRPRTAPLRPPSPRRASSSEDPELVVGGNRRGRPGAAGTGRSAPPRAVGGCPRTAGAGSPGDRTPPTARGRGG